MNILFVNNYYNLFAKADSGASQRSMCMIRAFAKIGHVDVVSFMDDTVSNEPNVDVIYSHYVENASRGQDNRIAKFLRLFCWHKPYVIYSENKQKSRIIDEFVQKNQYDYIVTRYIQFACDNGLLKYHNRLILDVDDDSKDAVLMAIDKVKTLRNKVYSILYANTMDSLTKYITSHVKCAFYSTPNKYYPNAVFLPNISAYGESLPPADFSRTERVILMIGTYQYLPNLEGLTHFLQNIYPIVRRDLPTVSLHIAGSMVDGELRQLCERTNGVKLLGYVADLKAAYADCHCAIVPLFRGTGTSVKMIEAMSMGRAVVSTSVGARGLNVQISPNEDYILADDNQTFAAGIVKLLTDEQTNHLMAERATSKVRQYYSAEKFNSILIRAIVK